MNHNQQTQVQKTEKETPMIGASLSAEQVEQFDNEHDKLLKDIAPDIFSIHHQMTVQIYVKKGVIVSQ